MRRFSGRAAGLLAAAVVGLIGCGPGKELPDTIPEPKGTKTGPADPVGKVPDASEPAAKAVVDKAIAAVTKNAPDELAKAKFSRCVCRGQVYIELDGPADDAVRRIEAVWPDRSRAGYEFKDGARPNKLFVYHHPLAWMYEGGRSGNVNPADVAPLLRTDLTGQYWFFTGIPLGDTRAVAFDAQKSTLDGRAVTAIKFALPELPIYQLTFDDPSGLLSRVDYTATEFGQRVRYAAILTDHKEAGGLVVPFGLERIRNGQVAEKWAVETWEFPEKIDDETFAPPK